MVRSRYIVGLILLIFFEHSRCDHPRHHHQLQRQPDGCGTPARQEGHDVVCLTAALFGPAGVSIVAFPLVGFFASIMWPVISSLALNSVPGHHGSFAGILCTGIVGGAIGPIIIGRLGDPFGMRVGMSLLYLTFGCVLSVGFWAKPLITNAIILQKKEN
jgi:MFS transporter, FHS family, L-fucose permease